MGTLIPQEKPPKPEERNPLEAKKETPIAPIPTVTPDGVMSVTGRSTIFGLNYDGTIDTGDNGQGYFGYNTRDHSLVGVSLPIPVIDHSIGNHKDPDIIRSIKKKKFTVHVMHRDIGITAPIVDIGPSVWSGNAIDLTYAATKLLGITDNSTVTYEILDLEGEPIEIKGWKT